MDERLDGVVPNSSGEAANQPCHLVVTVHGIRTYGNWQADLKDLLEEAEPGIVEDQPGLTADHGPEPLDLP